MVDNKRLKQSYGLVHVLYYLIPKRRQGFPARPYIAYGDAQDILAVEGRIGKEEGAGFVQRFHEGPIRFIGGSIVGTAKAEANQGEMVGRADFEAGIGGDAVMQFAGHGDLVADDAGEAFVTVVAEHEPQFEGTESPTERNSI